MKNLHIYLVFVLVATIMSCRLANDPQDQSGSNFYANLMNNNGENPTAQMVSTTSSSSNELVSHSILDARTGQETNTIMLPASWKYTNEITQEGQAFITGPEGIEVANTGSISFVYTTHNFNGKEFQTDQQLIRVPIGLKELVQTDINKKMQAKGYQFVSGEDMPGMKSFNERIASVIFANTKIQATFETAALVYQSKNDKVLLLIDHQRQDADGVTTWGYSECTMKAPPHLFESAKSVLINAYNTREENSSYVQQLANQMNQPQTQYPNLEREYDINDNPYYNPNSDPYTHVYDPSKDEYGYSQYGEMESNTGGRKIDRLVDRLKNIKVKRSNRRLFNRNNGAGNMNKPYTTPPAPDYYEQDFYNQEIQVEQSETTNW